MTDLAAIRARAAAAIGGPWKWRGNTDTGDVRLVGHILVDDTRNPGWQRPYGLDVFGTIREERTVDDPGAKEYAEYLRDVRILDRVTREYRPYTADEIAQGVLDDWVNEKFSDEPRTDNYIAFVNATSHFYEAARDLAIYEVARAQGLPDDTPRDHPKVYRADLIGIRNANAEFIEHSRQDVDDLLAIIDAATQRCIEINESGDCGRHAMDDVIAILSAVSE